MHRPIFAPAVPDRTAAWERDMQQSAFDPQDESWNSPSKTLRTAERDGAQEMETWPTPGELFLQTGIVLAVALGVVLAIDLIMGAV
jgi:hypothetical protein